MLGEERRLGQTRMPCIEYDVIHGIKCLRIQIAAAPVKGAAVSTKHPVLLAALFLAGEQW